MEVHTPKPVHGWREFASEIGVIVIGVMIALAAEQAVEWLHWREKAADARHALRSELADAYRASAERIMQKPCIDAQLDFLKHRTLTAGATLPPAPLLMSVFGPTVIRHSSRVWDDTIWQSVLSEQVSSHFGEAERQNYAFFYNTLADLRRLNREEDGSNGPLAPLASRLPLVPSLRGQLVELIEAERERADFMDLLAKQEMQAAKDLVPDVARALRDPMWRNEIGNPLTTLFWCRAHHLPLAPMPTP